MATTTSITPKGDYGRRYAIISGYDERIRAWSRKQYLTFEAKEDNTTISWNTSQASWTRILSVSRDGGVTWDNKTSAVAPGTVLATINKGQKLLVKYGRQNAFMSGNAYYNFFSSDKDVYVYGNIMSLTEGDDFLNVVTLRARYQFGRLFYGMTTLLTDRRKGYIVFPATGNHVANPYAYDSTFNGCSKMTVPALIPDNMALGVNSFFATYQNCSSMKGTQLLRFTSIGSYGCSQIFQGSGIEELIIDDATLDTYAFRMAFRNCPGLKKVTSKLTDISASNCLQGWLDTVAASGTFVKPASVTYPSGSSGIPSGWTVQDYVA